MARQVTFLRDEAEYLVDLLEALPTGPGKHHKALDIADDLREAFGMGRRDSGPVEGGE